MAHFEEEFEAFEYPYPLAPYDRKKEVALLRERIANREAGMPGMYISFWHGLWMPRGVPKDILAKVNAAVLETLADETVRKRLSRPSCGVMAPWFCTAASASCTTGTMRKTRSRQRS